MHQANVSISVQQDQDQQDNRTEVTVEPKRRHHQSLWQTKTTFVRIACINCPPSNWPLWDPFPPNIWEEDPGLYK